MKHLVHRSHQGLSGNLAVVVFLLSYAAILAFVIAPDAVTSALDTDMQLWSIPD